MSISKKELELNELNFLDKATNSETAKISANGVKKANVYINGEEVLGFAKKLGEEYSEFLAIYSIMTSVFYRLELGEQAAEDFLVYEEGKIWGTWSRGIKDYKRLNFVSDDPPKPEDKEDCIPSEQTLVSRNIMLLLIVSYFFFQKDLHAGNISVKPEFKDTEDRGCLLDYDGVGPIPESKGLKDSRIIENGKFLGPVFNVIKHTPLDFAKFPNVTDFKPCYFPTLDPGNYYKYKGFAGKEEFKKLEYNWKAIEQKYEAFLRIFLTCQPTVLRARLEQFLGKFLNINKLFPSKRRNSETVKKLNTYQTQELEKFAAQKIQFQTKFPGLDIDKLSYEQKRQLQEDLCDLVTEYRALSLEQKKALQEEQDSTLSPECINKQMSIAKLLKLQDRYPELDFKSLTPEQLNDFQSEFTGLPLNFMALKNNNQNLNSRFPALFNKESNCISFVDFAMEYFQILYDSGYRGICLFQGSTEPNEANQRMPSFNQALHQYKAFPKIEAWMMRQNALYKETWGLINCTFPGFEHCGLIKLPQDPLKYPFADLLSFVKNQNALVAYNNNYYYVIKENKQITLLEFSTPKSKNKFDNFKLTVNFQEATSEQRAKILFAYLKPQLQNKDSVILLSGELYFADHRCQSIIKIPCSPEQKSQFFTNTSINTLDKLRIASEEEVSLIANLRQIPDPKTLMFDRTELKSRLEQVHRDSLSFTMKTIITKSFELADTLLNGLAKEKVSSNKDKRVESTSSITQINQLFAGLKLVNVEDAFKRLDCSASNAVLQGLTELINFNNAWLKLAHEYYELECPILTETHTVLFIKQLKKLIADHELAVIKACGINVSWNKEFKEITSEIEKFCKLANTQSLYDSQEKPSRSIFDQKIKHKYTDSIIIEQCIEALFLWVDKIDKNQFTTYITEMVDHYTNEATLAQKAMGTRAREQPVRDYLKGSADLDVMNHNRLAYIICSGKEDGGELNELVIHHLLEKMLPEKGSPNLPEVKEVFGKPGFEIKPFVAQAYQFGKGKTFVHLEVNNGMDHLIELLSNWVPIQTETFMKDMINDLAKKNQGNSWSMFNGGRKAEVDEYLIKKKMKPLQAILMIFAQDGHGKDAKSLNSLLINKLLEKILEDLKTSTVEEMKKLKNLPGYEILVELPLPILDPKFIIDLNRCAKDRLGLQNRPLVKERTSGLGLLSHLY